MRWERLGWGSWRGGLCAVGRSRVGTLGLAEWCPLVSVRKDVRGLLRKRGEGSFGRVVSALGLPPLLPPLAGGCFAPMRSFSLRTHGEPFFSLRLGCGG